MFLYCINELILLITASILLTMNSDEIKKLADLCRLNLTDVDVENYKKDFDGILKYINTLKDVEVDISKVEELQRNTHVNILREDDDFYVSGTYSDVLLDAAPEREGDYIKVKKVL